MRIYLIGFMGAGKTTFGKQLAQTIHHQFLDLDTIIEQNEHRSITEIFQTSGEAYFREIEQNTLIETGELNKTVIATGGGTPCFFDNMSWMNRKGVTVYLEESVVNLKDRLFIDKINRPMLNKVSDLETYIRETLAKRNFYYKQAAITFNSDKNINGLLDIIQNYSK